jgi:hypothetical protein
MFDGEIMLRTPLLLRIRNRVSNDEFSEVFRTWYQNFAKGQDDKLPRFFSTPPDFCAETRKPPKKPNIVAERVMKPSAVSRLQGCKLTRRSLYIFFFIFWSW